MKKNDWILKPLIAELETQVHVCEAALRDREAALVAVTPGVANLATQGDDYLRCLKEVQGQISGYLDGHVKSSWEDLPLPDTSFLWKFLAFSRPSGRFVDPSHIRERLESFLKVSGRPSSGDDGSFTRDLWESPLLDRWITSGQPPQIFLETLPAKSTRLHRFVLELIGHLEIYNPVVHMLSGLPPSVTDALFPELTSEVVLEQVAIQALRHVSLEKPLPFILQSLLSLGEASGDRDWFRVILDICETIPKISLVLDLAVLPPRFAHATKSWAMDLEKISSTLREKTGSRFQVMVLGPRHMFGESDRETSTIQTLLAKDPVKTRSAAFLPCKRPIPLPAPALKPVHEATSALISDEPESAESSTEITTQESLSHLHEPDSMSPAPTLPSNPPEEAETQPSIVDAQDFARRDSRAHQNQPLCEVSNQDPSKQQTSEASNALHGLSDPSKVRDQIKIAIMCALALEADAVEALFDDYWEDLEPQRMKAPGDTNAYSFGVIGSHRIVLVHMPSMGKSSGAIVAANCRNSFPNVKLALVVGICGGVPFYDKGKQEIVLGDVVISEGLIGYDFGRRFPDKFVRKASIPDSFGKPLPEIRALLNKLKGLRSRKRLREQTYQNLQMLRQELGELAEYPGATEDHLFEGAYRHRHNDPNDCTICSGSGDGLTAVCDKARTSTCDDLHCDTDHLVPRKRLDAIKSGSGAAMFEPALASPAVHFGYVASGDQVMKSGEHRDGIAKEEGVIAFEMEAAGVWDILPCLVIKGVCDYADSHKSKQWQDYAAATAAACAKAFLREWHM